MPSSTRSGALCAAAADAAVKREKMRAGSCSPPPRRAIEFTLNSHGRAGHGENVQPFSKLASLEATDPKLIEQVDWREYMKKFYVDVLSGGLRTRTRRRPRSEPEAKVAAAERFPAVRTAEPAPVHRVRRRGRGGQGPKRQDRDQESPAPQPQSQDSDLDMSGQTSWDESLGAEHRLQVRPAVRRIWHVQHDDEQLGLWHGLYVPRPDELRRRPRAERLFRLSVQRADEQRRARFQRLSPQYSSDAPNLFAPSSPSQQFSYASDNPQLATSSSSFDADAFFQSSGQSQFGQSQFGQTQFGQSQSGQSQIGQSSTSLGADNPFTTSLSGETLEAEMVDETLLEVALL